MTTIDDIKQIMRVHSYFRDKSTNRMVLDVADVCHLLDQLVVSCKDCKHCYYASNRIPEQRCYACDEFGFDIGNEIPSTDFYCAFGERKSL